MYYYLYKITNLLNNKVYIGQSNKDKERWRQHKYFGRNPEKTGQYIHRAMAKYGIENFIYEIVAMCLTAENANETEIILIEQYNSRNKDYGYNIKPGGNTRGEWHHSDESRKKMADNWSRSEESLKKMSNSKKGKSINSKGKKKSLKHREAISKSHIGMSHNGNKDFRHTEETKNKMREASKGNKYAKGYKHTDEAKRKISEARKKVTKQNVC